MKKRTFSCYYDIFTKLSFQIWHKKVFQTILVLRDSSKKIQNYTGRKMDKIQDLSLISDVPKNVSLFRL